MNSCYCQKDKGSSVFTKKRCPPAGIFNASSCNFGMPTLTSFPHFYQADETIIEQIDGLDPQKELHESYVDLHPVSFNYYLLLGMNHFVSKLIYFLSGFPVPNIYNYLHLLDAFFV